MKTISLSDLIKSRIARFAYKQNYLLEKINDFKDEGDKISAAQLNKFINGTGQLSRNDLELLFQALQVDLNCYTTKNNLAIEVADIFIRNNITSVDTLSKDQMIAITGKKELKFLIDIDNQEDQELFTKSNFIDYENTFVMFKATVEFYLQLYKNKVDIHNEDEIKYSSTNKVLKEFDNVAAHAVSPLATTWLGGGLVSMGLKAASYIFSDKDKK